MITTEMVELLQRAEKLALPERLWLLERLAASVRRTVEGDDSSAALAAMAADPDMQRVLRNEDLPYPCPPEPKES
jgi:hypothetical protein